MRKLTGLRQGCGTTTTTSVDGVWKKRCTDGLFGDDLVLLAESADYLRIISDFFL